MTKRKATVRGAVMSLTVNEHTLSGENRNGSWHWTSTVPGVNGCMTVTEATEAFMARALAGAVTVKQLARGLKK